jgi:hypothetical protein
MVTLKVKEVAKVYFKDYLKVENKDLNSIQKLNILP